MASLAKAGLWITCLWAGLTGSAWGQPPSRTSAGLLALYEFSDASGPEVHDRSGGQPPADLTIADMKAVRWNAGSLEVLGETQILSSTAPQRLIETIRRTGSLTIEAWLQPAANDQQGPARIVTLSRDAGIRNFTLGQDGDKYDVRLRTTENGNNGTPSLGSQGGSLTTELTHVVYTRRRTGQASLYLNGQLNSEFTVPGRFSNWNEFRLGLANEQGGGRPWLGTLSLVAIYGRPLNASEVSRHYEAGPEAPTAPGSGMGNDPRAVQFETKIAPLLSEHCLECHDRSTANGGLDLSGRASALQGGDQGVALVAGQSHQSLLWELIESDDMPHDRPPLSAEAKRLIADWIDQGATWSLERIDPADYVHGNQTPETWVRRLTVAEYIETVRSATGVDIAGEAHARLPADLRADGFSNTAYNLNVDLKHIDAYAQLAELIVSRMDVPKFVARFSPNRRLTDDDMGTLIGRMGKWLLRSPLDDYEISVFRGISTSVAAAGGDFDEAVALIIEAMLQSPRFLYRMENQIGSGGLLPVNEYELASRMSYLVWGGPPDETLLELADNGSLLDEEIQHQQLDRMLADPRARQQSARFISDWLNLDRLDNLSPHPERFPEWKPELAVAMKRETLAYFDEVVWQRQLPLSKLLNAQFTSVTPDLAKHYGLPAQDSDPNEHGLVRYDLSDVPHRGGLLTQGSLLTIGGDDASMVTRGLLVMHELLRGVVKDPPPCVDTTPVPSQPGLTQRTIAMGRILNANCGGCHAKFEPLAFGLEPFDGLGAFHLRDEHGNELHDDGEILIPGDAKPTRFDSSSQLMDLLADSDRVKQSLTWKLTQFALGRPLSSADVAQVNQIHQAAQEAGGRYSDTLKAIVRSDLIQQVRTRPPETLKTPD